MTESALALSAIRSYLGSDPAIRASILNEPQIRATDRITIRLRPGDGRWIARRAQERGMKSSAYLAALVRAHVACDPPLPMEKIRILKRAVTVLVDLGRIVNNKIPTEITAMICDTPVPRSPTLRSGCRTSPRRLWWRGRAVLSRPSPAIALRHEPLLDLYSAGRPGSTRRDRFTAAQLEYIRRTVRRTPEVMVKVTGGGRTIAGVRAHLAYISHEGEAEIEDDRGEPVDKQDQKALVRGWHLELSSSQYRPTKDPESARARLSSCTTWCFRCPPPRRRVRCWPQLSTSPVCPASTISSGDDSYFCRSLGLIIGPP